MLRGLTGLNLVGGDVVEVAPAYDHAEITSIAAATVDLRPAHPAGPPRLTPGSRNARGGYPGRWRRAPMMRNRPATKSPSV